MPVLSRFYGIIIKMYFQQADHNPPHIHAVYGEYAGIIDIQTCTVIEGDLPNRVEGLIKEWINIHKDELINIWNTHQFVELPPLK